MKSGFKRLPAMADPEPPPEPTPFPIKIVTEPPPPPVADDLDLPSPVPGKRNDQFYSAWEKFLAVEPKRAIKTSRAAHEIEVEKEAVRQSPGGGLQIKENAAKSWEEAAAECKTQVAAIVEECVRLNQKYRDAIFDLEANPYCVQSLTGRYPNAVDKVDPPPWIKRVEDIFDKPEFFIDGASATDVHQGSSGDCWFLAALMAVSAKKELIDCLCVARDEKVGVYGFVFYRDDEWIYEVIDDKLFLRVGDDDDLQVVRDWDSGKKEGLSIKHDEDKLKDTLQKGGTALYFSHCKSNETWLPLIEKAYAKAHGDYFAIEGGFASEGIEDLTGGVAVVLNPEDIMDKERFWREQLSQVNQKYLFGGGSKPTGTKGMVGGHAYAVLEAWEEGDLKLLKLRNPWGEVEWEGDWSDGSKLWTPEMMIKLKHTFGDDGIFWMSYKHFLKHFPCINRVRLFDEGWSVAQQWTCVTVPWTIDYLDTKFRFTVSEKGPVVLVLAQPDDRYFYGLRGRYLYSMHFRVYKDGDETRYIVRSMHNSGNETVFTRSVSAEIEDMEPGTYNVVFKVTAMRSTISSTAEEAIIKYAVERKEKLLHVGRRFDYAQSKGDLRNKEKAVKALRKQNRKDKDKSGWKKNRMLTQQDRERAKKRKKRVDDAMKEKRKEFHDRQRGRAKAREERMRRKAAERQAAALAASDDATAVKPDELTPASSEDVAIEKDATAKAAPEDVTEGAAQPDQPDTAKGDDVIANLKRIEDEKGAEALTEKVSDLRIQDEPRERRERRDLQRTLAPSRRSRSISPVDDDSEYESPLEPPEDMDDDDFDWDSEMDGPISSGSSEGDASPTVAGMRKSSRAKNDIFADDPWSAICVLGLRIYTKSKDCRVSVVKGEDEA
ncbi:Calpain-type cysteine protease ADL1 [Fulvia fulva]|uniref:Calpain-type cysteine protease ADL1 n=1 Tax=Passalora fulva TaxID=5499 RepID=A0A9Q8PFH0_PASFU|nr:Calpain-type cysteine protease ADL1 [Fulvia fulva]KAK4613236.1 Calpain-type cysteine protease ADL1 [Fulvia fulva]UJO21466.1 Calpain-type cysteine protease ADL1 [Fulvia fulva]WPV20423.1 Calpain-type cysteine protease ADL1 [Fulvia fulva]WPV34813.1 Calpain-type cysteine protease ADL1 [Fulvia fulva]